mmetsp:Transcript_17376/g.40530  ORF Transcript_17376/g.40530 Transcript_17376/m.40530 type:complete len:240 (+) Transcript_17376:1019-1738(+)
MLDGNFGFSNAKFKLFEPTLVLVISAGCTVHLQPRSLVKFICTLTSFTAASPFAASAAACKALASGRVASSTVKLPLMSHFTWTHFPSKSFARPAEMAGSKQVASSTPKFLARTAQCDKMSGASFALLTSTATTPSGTSSSPLTAPLSSTVGVSNTLSWMCTILSIKCSSPCTGFSTAEISCQGGKCASSRRTGSRRCKIKLTAINEVPRKTSSTNTSMLCLGTPTCSPRKADLGPIKR